MKKVLISILIILLVVAIFIGVKWGIAYANDNIEPMIYYSFNDNPNLPLENNNVFSNNMTIMWTNECRGNIKKDGVKISNKNGTLLLNEGIYEITVKSPSGKNMITRTLKLDKTPPKVTVKKNLSGAYNITFEDVNDVGQAILHKFDLETNEMISRVDLAENVLTQSIEINEKGYYVFYAIDKIGNSTEEIEFSIE